MNKEYKDRGMLKWQPFDSVMSGKKAVNEAYLKRQKIQIPILSEDQLNELNDLIKEAYYSNNTIKIHYFFSGNIIIKKAKIKNINYNKKQIILNDNTIIYYKQITKVEII